MQQRQTGCSDQEGDVSCHFPKFEREFIEHSRVVNRNDSFAVTKTTLLQVCALFERCNFDAIAEITQKQWQ